MLTLDDLNESEELDEALRIDGFDDCIIGVARRCGQPSLLVYDSDKIIERLIDQGMLEEDAYDYYSFNIAGAWMGEGTPIQLERIEQ